MNIISVVREERWWQKPGYENETSDLEFSENFHFQKDGDVLFPVPRTKYNQILYIKQNKHKKTLKGGETVDWLGTLGPKEQHGSELVGFSFCLLIRLGAGETTQKQQ